ncbi:MAG TPA: RNA 2',3'-cyclic phosphodiesterase [Pyrinomonadaceae bacterium]|nr:RNA 2',3'-cyclic phosphodiesterase [Pyrinomonadaceae bacterium]
MSVEQKNLWRVFCAVELPPDVKERVARRTVRLRETVPDARAAWERTEKLHLTIKFLGEIERARVEALGRAAERAASGVEPFELTIEGAGAFPPRGLPRVIWLGVRDASGLLAKLRQRLEDECAAENFPRERRDFNPHLTLARLRAPADARRLADLHLATPLESVSFEVPELVVIRSELGPGGSRHTILTRHELKARSHPNG